jgi:hypothetical protein
MPFRPNKAGLEADMKGAAQTAPFFHGPLGFRKGALGSYSYQR